MIRAVFFDIDGTLVSLKTKRCPDSTKAAIRALREKGIRVYVASGRSRFELEEQEMLRGMTFDGYLTNNGQIVYGRQLEPAAHGGNGSGRGPRPCGLL